MRKIVNYPLPKGVQHFAGRTARNFLTALPDLLYSLARTHMTTAPPVILTAAKQWVELLAPLEQGEHAL